MFDNKVAPIIIMLDKTSFTTPNYLDDLDWEMKHWQHIFAYVKKRIDIFIPLFMDFQLKYVARKEL